MTRQKLAKGLDVEALRHADEQSDAQALANFYVEDASVHIVNRNSPPSSPFVLRGREAIAEYLRTVCANGARHRIENEILGKDRLAFNVAWPVSGRNPSAHCDDARDARRQNRLGG